MISAGGGSGGGGGISILLGLAILLGTYLLIGYASLNDIRSGTGLKMWSTYALVRALPVLLVIWVTTASVLRSCLGKCSVRWYYALGASLAVIAGPENSVILGHMLLFPLATLRPDSDNKVFVLGTVLACWIAFVVGGAMRLFGDFPSFQLSDLARALVSTCGMPTDPSHFVFDLGKFGEAKNPHVGGPLFVEILSCFYLAMSWMFIPVVRDRMGSPPKVWMWLMVLHWTCFVASIPILGVGQLQLAWGICVFLRVSSIACISVELTSVAEAHDEDTVMTCLKSIFNERKQLAFGLFLMTCVEVANVFGVLSML